MIKRLVASTVIVALALLTPGGRFYEACAQTIAAPAARAGVMGSAGAVGAVNLQLAIPTPAPSLAPTGLHSSLAIPSAPAPLAAPLAAPAALAAVAPIAAAKAVPVSARAVPAALKPVALAAAKSDAAPVVSGAASAPKTFAEAKTGEAAAVLFDQGVSRSALDVVLPAASSEEKPAASGLEPAKAPAAGAPDQPPAPAGKTKLPRSLWGLFWGHHIVTVFGVNFHILSQPFLVKDALGMGTATMGLVRNIHMGSMAIVNFLPIGYLIDKTDYRAVFTATTLARAALMGAIPMLFAAGALPFTVLALIVAINPIFQSAMIVADGAARKSFLGKDEKLNKDAAATLSKWDSLAGMLMPLIAGWAVGWLVTTMGLGGYAMAYGVYAALLLASLPIYWSMIRDPRFPAHDKLGVWGLASQTAVFMAALGASVIHPFTLMLRWSFNSIFPGARAPMPEGRAAKAAWLAREVLVSVAGAALFPVALLKALLRVPAAWRAAKAMRSSGKGASPASRTRSRSTSRRRAWPTSCAIAS
ncbi:MAG: hypothetical protein M0D55_06050 [Elusimicrobiota bacterium]|nr:MAG: hypothetical protein M0D55_06050 [Elusimicrobiota bacterium]